MQTQVLNKGLKFVPTKVPSDFDITVDIHKFVQKMYWRAYFSKEGKQPLKKDQGLNKYPHKLKTRGHNEPPISIGALDTFKKMVLHDLEVNFFKKRTGKREYNLTKDENRALKELSNNPSLIIKKADKGGGIVVMDRDKYIAEALRQLADESTYRKLSKDPTPELSQLIGTCLQEAMEDGLINEDTKKVLLPKEPRTPILYLLPKIHKDAQNPPGRPIVSGTGSLLQASAPISSSNRLLKACHGTP